MNGQSLANVIVAICLVRSVGMAQDAEISRQSFEIALEPATVLTAPVGSLESIRGSVPCSDAFAPTFTVNPSLGVRFAWITDARDRVDLGPMTFRGLSISGGWDDITTRFKSTPDNAFQAFDQTVGTYVDIQTRHEAEFFLTAVRTALQAEFGFGGDLFLRTGPSVALPLSARSVEHERIIEPSNATFLDRTQLREIPEGTGPLTDVSTRIGFCLNVAYRMPLGSSLFFEPTIGVDIGVNRMQPSWSPFIVRGGISLLHWGRKPPPPPPLPPPPPPPIPEPPIDIPFAADLSIEVAGGVEQIPFRRQIVAQYVPILPMVFFERNDATLPSQYHSIGAFSEDALPPNAEIAHSRTLDVFGARLSRTQTGTVTIVGTTSGDETGRLELAQARAESVAEYFRTRWGIARSRMVVRSRVEPANPSNPAYAEGLEENRRVELDFSTDDVYRPVQLRTIEPTADPRSIVFQARARSAVGIDRWEMGITADQRRIAALGGKGGPPELIEWTLSMNNREEIMTARRTTFRLAVFDSIGRTVAIEDLRLPVRLDTTVSVTTLDRQPDARADFLLVTFDFDRAELTRRGREELRTILRRIAPNSIVDVVGYTDPIGEAEHNRTLAVARARNVAAQVPRGISSTFRGATPEEAPYTATTPAGRFLSRTVRVVIEQPR